MFENDVKMYGAETQIRQLQLQFENDVKMYGTKTIAIRMWLQLQFENDVKMYGTKTDK